MTLINARPGCGQIEHLRRCSQCPDIAQTWAKVPCPPHLTTRIALCQLFRGDSSPPAPAGSVPSHCHSCSGPETGFPAGSHLPDQPLLVSEPQRCPLWERKAAHVLPCWLSPGSNSICPGGWEFAPTCGRQSWSIDPVFSPKGWPSQIGATEFSGCGPWLAGQSGESGHWSSGDFVTARLAEHWRV